MRNTRDTEYQKRPTGSAENEILGVHILTQFIYCPLAGLAQYEDKRTDRHDGQAPRKDYLPEYDREEIRRVYNEYVQQIKVVSLMYLAFVITSLIGWWLFSWWYAVVLAAGSFVVVCVGWDKVRAAVILHQRRNEYLRAQPADLSIPLREDTNLNWWGLLKSGFDLFEGEKLTDHKLKITGRPFRVLRKGGLTIPVFYYTGDAAEVRYRDRARIAAYCRLLTENEGCESPYGIILRTGSYTATAVPNDDRAQGILRKELPRARRVIQDSLEERDPDKPGDSQNCRTCPLGKPLLYDPRRESHFQYDVPIRPKPRSYKGRSFHSQCGDRFGWTPPHQRAIRFGWIFDSY